MPVSSVSQSRDLRGDRAIELSAVLDFDDPRMRFRTVALRRALRAKWNKGIDFTSAIHRYKSIFYSGVRAFTLSRRRSHAGPSPRRRPTRRDAPSGLFPRGLAKRDGVAVLLVGL